MYEERMIIYRAMCREEFARTLKFGKADFSLRRFKWFATDLDFIMNRVLDKTFNNSRHVPDRYVHIVQFEADVSKADWIRNHEIQFDVRRNAKILMIQEIFVDTTKSTS